MGSEQVTWRSAVSLARGIAAGEVDPVELLDACLVVIERLNPTVNAVVTLAADRARAEALAARTAVDRGEELGPLHGLPILVKDVTETAGIRTTYASPLFRDHVPEEDAEVVARLRRAGAIILGKTNTPEFAAGANTVNRVFGATRNPWNTELSPSGSSGGSAVAVATGMVPLAHGTDYGCSVRMPAAFCGIVGLRTTPGLIPSEPLPLPWDPGQVHGPLARSASDAALMLDAMTGLDPFWPIAVAPAWSSALDIVEQSESPAGLRIAYAPDIARIGVDAEVDRVCRAAIERLAGAGAVVEEIDLDLSPGISAYKTLRAEWMVGQQVRLLDRLDELDKNLTGNVRQGLALTPRELAAARTTQEAVWRQTRAVLSRFDFVLTPMAPVQPFPVTQNFPDRIGDRSLADYIDWIAPAFLITLVSLVGGSVPAGLSRDGLPVGLQIVGRRLSEPYVLALAKHIQSANPIGHPPLADLRS